MKKILAFALSAFLMASALVGCGAKKDASTASSAAESTGGDTSGSVAGQEVPAEFVTLKWYLHGSNVTDDTEVLEKANAYLKEKLNCAIEPIWGTWGDFDEGVVLSLQGGDDVDIYFTCSWSANEYNSFARKGYYLRLDDPENNLIEKYGADLWKTLPGVITDGAKISGKDGVGVYAVPGYKDYATQNCWDVNVPLLEEYGYTIDDIKNTDFYGFGEILETVKKGEGKDFYPLLCEGAVMERMATNSIIVTGDAGTNNILSNYIDPKDPSKSTTEITSKFETPEYKKFVEKAREYFLAGYIDPAMGNANQANDVRNAKMKEGAYLINTQSYALGYEVQASAERGFEVAMVPATVPYVDTTSSQGAMMAISSSSKNPERAMMFLNLLNTDPYLFTLLDFGVEGVHYDMKDNKAVFTAKRDDYRPWTNGMGNVTQLPVQDGQDADFWDVFRDYYGSAKEIPLLGWAFDATPVEVEMGALANVAGEYALALSTGTVDPAVKLPEFIDKLNANGMEKVVEEANNQVKEYLAAK